MNFEINNMEWEIIEKNGRELIDLYSTQYPEEEAFYVFGLTSRSKHVIYINEDMCEEQKTKTLKHELTHCYIWCYGLYNVPNFSEEMVCDLVSSSNDFVNRVVRDFRDNKLNKVTEHLKETRNKLNKEE